MKFQIERPEGQNYVVLCIFDEDRRMEQCVPYPCEFRVVMAEARKLRTLWGVK